MSHSIYAIYCDDVRQEVGGKTSFMGVYRGAMLLPNFPFTMRQFYAVVILTCDPVKAPKKLVIRMTLESNSLVDMEMDLPPPPNPVDTHMLQRNPSDFRVEFQTIIDMTNITFPGPGILRLHIIADDVEMRGPGIDILPLGALQYPVPTPGQQS